MSGGDLTKNINRVRTFKSDAALMHEGKEIQLPSVSVGEEKPKASPAQKVTTVPKTVNIQKASPTHNVSHAFQPKTAVPQAHKSLPKQYLELTDEVAQIAKPHKESILADSTHAHNITDEGNGSIIRDTKRKRFKLFPAILSATTGWIRDNKDAYNTQKRPQHTVAKAEARKDTLVQATAQAELAPRDDFATVVKRLKEVERTPVAATLTFKKKSEVPKAEWTHVQEEIQSEPSTTPEPLEKEAEELSQTAVTPLPALEETADEAPLKTEEVAPEISTESEGGYASEPVVETPLVNENQEQQPEVIVEEPVLPLESTFAEEDAVQEIQESTPVRRYAPSPTASPSAFPILIFVAVVFVATVLGVGSSYYWFVLRDAPSQNAVVYKVPALLNAQTQIPVELITDKVALFSLIEKSISESAGIIQIYPTTPAFEGGSRPASAEEISTVLQLRAPNSFVRNISEITFGGVMGEEPFIVMKVQSFDTAFAGMLEWERILSADLSPLFGRTVTQSFDPSARTTTQIRSAFFRDVISSNKSIRLLTDETGADRITYTFVDRNTILITTTRETLGAILPYTQ